MTLPDPCAEEGAQKPIDYAAGMAEAEQESPWLWRLVPVAVVLAATLSACWPLGFAA